MTGAPPYPYLHSSQSRVAHNCVFLIYTVQGRKNHSLGPLPKLFSHRGLSLSSLIFHLPCGLLPAKWAGYVIIHVRAGPFRVTNKRCRGWLYLSIAQSKCTAKRRWWTRQKQDSDRRSKPFSKSDLLDVVSKKSPSPLVFFLVKEEHAPQKIAPNE